MLVRGADGVTVTSDIVTVSVDTVSTDIVFEDKFEDGNISDWSGESVCYQQNFVQGRLYLEGTGVEFEEWSSSGGFDVT